MTDFHDAAHFVGQPGAMSVGSGRVKLTAVKTEWKCKNEHEVINKVIFY